MRERIKTCFIAASREANLEQLVESLGWRGVQVLGLSSLDVIDTIQHTVFDSIRQADLVVGVLTHRRSANAIFELGIAAGLGKQIMVFAPRRGANIPFDLQQYQIVRTSLRNREAIDFAFDQLLASPEGAMSPARRVQTESKRLGASSENYRHQLQQVVSTGSPKQLENLVAKALAEAGAELVVEAPERERGFDLVIWSDDLQAYVGNPLPIEIKRRLLSREQARNALTQCASAAASIGSVWSLLLYAEGPSAEDKVWLSHPNVLAIGIQDLFHQLDNSTFADVVRALRNRRMHGRLS